MRISNHIRTAAAIIAILSFPGCFKTDFAEEVSCMVSDKETIIVDADLISGEPVRDTLTISSNRSVSVHFKKKYDWVSIDGEDEFSNLEMVTRDMPVHLKFTDNRNKSEREAELIITSEDDEISIPIRQRAIRYRLSIDSSPEVTDIRPEQDSSAIVISSNVEWQARIVEGATASVGLSTSSGFGRDTLWVFFDENEDPVNPAAASVLISASECEDVTVSFHQLPGIPYARILQADVVTQVDPMGSATFIPIRSNGKWTIRLKDGSTLKDVAFWPAEGDKDCEKIGVWFAPNNDPHAEREATVVLKSESGSESELTFTQGAGLTEKTAILIPFRVYPDNLTSEDKFNPFTKDMNGSSIAFTTDMSFTYTLSMFNLSMFFRIASGGQFYYNSNGGFQLGSEGDYFLLPALEDKKLVKVLILQGNSNSVKGTIMSTDGSSVIKGGETITTTSSYSKKVDLCKTISQDLEGHPKCIMEFNLQGTENGVRYRYALGNKNFIRFIYLEYE